jgi:WD40 repeat protein
VGHFASDGDRLLWLDFSPDGTRLASGDAGNTVKLWDVASGRELLSLGGHQGGVNGGGFSPDGKVLVSADGSSALRLWSGARRRELFNWSFDHMPPTAAWDLGRPGTFFPGWGLLAWSCDGRLASIDVSGSQAVLRDPRTGRRLFAVGPESPFYFLRDDPGSGRGGNLVGRSLAFRPDGRELALGLGAFLWGEIEVWDLARRSRRHRLVGLGNWPVGLAYSPDGRRLASANHDRTASVWDMDSGKRLVTFREHGARVNGVAFSPDGRRLATCGDDGRVFVWEADTGKVLLRLDGPRGAPGTLMLAPDPWSVLLGLHAQVTALGAVAWGPDGRRLAACGLSRVPANRVVLVWDARNGRELLSLRGHQGDVYHLAYRPDGKVLASASADRTVRLWDAATGKELLALAGHHHTVLRLAFSPDGKALATTGLDGSVRVWDVADVVPGE